MYPLISNDRSLSPAQLLAAHKGQPKIEKRFGARQDSCRLVHAANA